MQRLVASLSARLRAPCLALLLVLACLVDATPPSAHAAIYAGSTQAPVVTRQVAEAPLVPPPAQNYSLDLTAPGSFPGLGSGLRAEDPETSPDGSYHWIAFHTLSSESATVTVESTVYILASSGQADQKFAVLQTAKRMEAGVPLKAVGGWPADRVSTYQTANGSGDGKAGVVLRYHNAVGLVEIEGRGPHATADTAKTLMMTMLQAFQRAAQPAEAPASQ